MDVGVWTGDTKVRRIRPLDVIMLVLGAVSFGLLVWITAFTVSDGARELAIYLDYALCLVFLAEFLWQWRLAGWAWVHPLLRWYDIVGMIPVATPYVRGLRLLRIVVIIARYNRDSDRPRMTDAFIDRLAHTIVAGAATSMERNQAAMETVIMQSIHADDSVRRLRHLPFHETMVRLVAEAAYRILFQAMTDPRTDEFVAEMLRDNMGQMRIRMITRGPD